MRGFTLIEVVVALVVLNVGVLGVAGLLQLAHRTLSEAERLEVAVATSEGVLDSLAGELSPASGSASIGGVRVVWSVDSTRTLDLWAVAGPADTLLGLQALLGRR